MALITSLLIGGVNNHQETAEHANGLATDLVTKGVVGAITATAGVAPMTGSFAVNAQGTPDMTVAVSAGVAYVTATPSSQNSQALRVRNTAATNVTISANSSGSTKYDWLYISISAANAAAPNTAGDNVATLVTSRSSSSSSDDGTPPTYGTILAVVTVANGASSITNGNISDSRAAGLLSTNALQNSAVSTAKIADVNVTTAKIADDAITDAKLVHGKVRSRQGGSATNWSTSGTTNYDYSGTTTFIQVGAIFSVSGANVTVTFPTAYSQIPLVIGSTGSAQGSNAWPVIHSVTTTTFQFRMQNDAGSSNNTEILNWIAIGQ